MPRHRPEAARVTVLGRLEGVGRAEAVANRLRDAIQLGLLRPGEQLPSEMRLAGDVGVSTVTLREALASLRQEGLIVTRRGRGGGTFVLGADEPRRDYLFERLHEMSIDELRDVADIRTAIAGTSARLAARRASRSDLDRLEQHRQALAHAITPEEQRRADGRFHIEIAAMSRSSRLTREEMSYQAAFGPLIWLALNDSGAVAHVLSEHDPVADAIRRGDPKTAQARMESHVEFDHAQIIELHRALFAPARPRGSRLALDQVMRAVEDLVEEVFRSIDETRDAFIEAHRAKVNAAATFRRDDLTPIRDLSRSHLERHAELLAGTGVVCALDLLADAPRWLDWLCPAGPGQSHLLTVSLDPSDPEYYDYENAAWFDVPLRTRRRSVFGPFLDYSGTDQHILTLTEPVFDGDRFLGVAGADISIGGLEANLYPVFTSGPDNLLLVNDEARVILSMASSVVPGELLPEPERSLVLGRDESSGARTWLNRSRALPWALVRLRGGEELDG